MRCKFLIRGLAQAALLLLSAACGPAFAQEQPPQAPNPISVTGQVVDTDGKPIAGARVVLREWSSRRYEENSFARDLNDILAEAKSDAEGRFHFDKVAAPPFRRNRDAAPWDVIALADGFGLGWAHFAQSPGDQPAMKITLAPQKTIEGRLVDTDGKPIAGCNVEVVEITPPGSEPYTSDYSDAPRLSLWRSRVRPSAKTDDAGQFEIQGLPAGKRLALNLTHPRFVGDMVFVSTTDDPQPPVYQEDYATRPPRSVEKRVLESGFNYALKLGNQLRGRLVFADTKSPAADIQLELRTGPGSRMLMSDRDGRFEFTGLSEQKGIVTSYVAPPSGYLRARKLIEFRGDQREQEVTIELVRGLPVRGIVVDAETGVGVPDVGVQAIPPPLADDDRDEWGRATQAKTDAQGRFECLAAPGPLTLRVASNDTHKTHFVPSYARWAENKLIAPEHSAQIEVKPGQAYDGVKLVVGRGLVIRGQVVDAEGEPVKGAEVKVSSRQREPNPATTNAEGRFEVIGISDTGGIVAAYVRHAERKLSGVSKIEIEPFTGLTHVIDAGKIRIQRSVDVKGKVVVDGQPQADIKFYAYTYVPAEGTRGASNSAPFQLVTTAADGTFSFEAPPDEDFGMSVNITGYESDFRNERRDLPAGQSLELPLINLRSLVTYSGFIEGIVVDPAGKPVAGVTVSARGSGGRGGRGAPRGRGGAGGGPRTTADNGRFRLEGLPDGPLQMSAYVENPPDPDTGLISVTFPARVTAVAGQTDVRIIYDPKLKRTAPPRLKDVSDEK